MSCILQLDIQKAYDTVNTEILLQKFINHFNPKMGSLKLLRNYLSSRWIFTSVGQINSQKLLVNVGLPQGAVLSPLFFSYFFSSLSELQTHGKLLLFADDIQLLYRGRTVDERHVMEMMINEGMRPSFSVMPDAPWPIRADAMMAIRLMPISIAI